MTINNIATLGVYSIIGDIPGVKDEQGIIDYTKGKTADGTRWRDRQYYLPLEIYNQLSMTACWYLWVWPCFTMSPSHFCVESCHGTKQRYYWTETYRWAVLIGVGQQNSTCANHRSLATHVLVLCGYMEGIKFGCREDAIGWRRCPCFGKLVQAYSQMDERRKWIVLHSPKYDFRNSLFC